MKYFVMALALGFAMVSTTYTQDKKETKKEEKKADSKIDATKIVGKWEIAESDGNAPKGALVEFTKDGKLNIKIDFNGKAIELTGKYSIKDDQITVEIKGPDGSEEKDTDTIVSLSDTECKLKDKECKTTKLTKKK